MADKNFDRKHRTASVSLVLNNLIRAEGKEPTLTHYEKIRYQDLLINETPRKNNPLYKPDPFTKSLGEKNTFNVAFNDFIGETSRVVKSFGYGSAGQALEKASTTVSAHWIGEAMRETNTIPQPKKTADNTISKGGKNMSYSTNNFSEQQRKEYGQRKKAEFDSLVKVANDKSVPDSVRKAAQKNLFAIERKTDKYNREKNPAKLAEKLQEKADYYKAKANGTVEQFKANKAKKKGK